MYSLPAKSHHKLMAIILWLTAALACRGDYTLPLPRWPTSTPTAPAAATGYSRSNPYPAGEVASVPNGEVKVLETARGSAAWRAIREANMFNKPPPKGYEYLIVKLRVKSTHTDHRTRSIKQTDFKVTGERCIRYFAAAVVPPHAEARGRAVTRRRD